MAPKKPTAVLAHLGGYSAPDAPNVRGIGHAQILGADKKPDWARIKAALDQMISDSYEGPALIDWEPFTSLGTIKTMTVTLSDIRNVALVCRTWKPKAKWMWYAIPTRSIWNQGDEWGQNNLVLRQITELLTNLCTSQYDFVRQGPEDDVRHGRIVSLAREMALPGQEVVCYTSHRFHHSVQEYGYSIIPREEHVGHLKNLVRHGAGAICAWSGDWFDADYVTRKTADGKYALDTPLARRQREAFSMEMGVPIGSLSKDVIRTYLTGTLFPEVMDRVKEATS